MIGGVITWGLYSSFLKKKTFTLPLLTLVHVLCTFGLIFIIPQFFYEFSQGKTINFDTNLFLILIFLAYFLVLGLIIVGPELFQLLELIEQVFFYH